MTSTLRDHGIGPREGNGDVQISVNLRDLGAVTPLVKQGLIYRSSQVVSPTDLRDLGIRTVLDLRKAPIPCTSNPLNLSHAIGHCFLKLFAWIKDKIFFTSPRPQPSPSQNRLLHNSETQLQEAQPCWRCTSTCDHNYGIQANVYHVDVLPGLTTFFIFTSLPRWLQLKALILKLRKRQPELVIAAAVSDPGVLGFKKLYQIILARSKTQIVDALRLLVRDIHFPLLIHCIHGKDRTGLIVMLIYLLCNVPRDIIVKDYAQSEGLLRESRENKQLLGIPDIFATDEIISSAAEVMESTLDLMEYEYGGVESYLKKAGMRNDEIISIKEQLMNDHISRD